MSTSPVNLDAMIAREDFATQEAPTSSYENIPSISVRDFTPGGLIGPNLRKPDFQRETNHWSPEQVVSLLECYTNGDLIPSVILWRSSSHLFVIDGGHRLSALRAWVEDDYGDGPISQAFFGYEVSKDQKRIAKKTRALVEERVGSWQHFQSRSQQSDLSPEERQRVNTVVSRALPVQWVTGSPDKAESSFFKINTEGTPLDDIEELLLRSRRKPIAIAARAIIRAGTGHRYWSQFPKEIASKVELLAKDLHDVLFEPSLDRPVKTLALPLGGSKGVRTSLQILIDFLLIATRPQSGDMPKVPDTDDDVTGESTIGTLSKALALAKRITGNDSGSLGLHPAIYFYGPSGRHSSAMFMGTVSLFARHIANNDKNFFLRFTNVRPKLETVLITHKDLVATILQKHISRQRNEKYEALLEKAVSSLNEGVELTEGWLVEASGLTGKALTGAANPEATRFTDDDKSEIFISTALQSVPVCPICRGYMDVEKSVSYDHVTRVRDGGKRGAANGQLSHPFCNQSVKG